MLSVLRGNSLATAPQNSGKAIIISLPGGAVPLISFVESDGTIFSTTTLNGAVTLSLLAQAKNLIFAGPGTGANAVPTFRTLVASDLPAPLGLVPPTIVAFAQSPYAVLATDQTILVDTSGGAVILTLEAAPADGRILNIKRTTTDGNQLTVARNGKNIEGAAVNFTDATAALMAWQFEYSNTLAGWWIL